MSKHKSIIRTITFFWLILASYYSYSQTSTDEQLANQFYENGEYEKAVGLYKKVIKRNSTSIYTYDNYLGALIAMENEKDAISLVEKQQKRHPNNIIYQVDLGYVYTQFDRKDKASKYLNSLIKKSIDNRNLVFHLSQSFMRRQMSDYAIKTFEDAISRHGFQNYYSSLMNLYKNSSNTKDLTDLSLEVLLDDPDRLLDVVRKIDVLFEDEEASLYFQKQTLTYIQRHPNKQVFSELLLESYLQQKKYNAALKQAISMDQKNKEEGSRVLELSRLCVQNKEYNAAVKGYEYVLDLGQANPYYLEAEEGLINTLFAKTTTSFKPEKSDVDALRKSIKGFLQRNGETAKTAGVIYKLAELEIFYVKDIQSGINILENLINIPRQSYKNIAKSKLLLADAYLINNEIWEAKLLYGQVDKEFKEEPLGQEAKFRNAKLSYYIGEFDWAKSQLDILKTATSQLISNNAIELALLIQDNTGLDSTEDAMKEYALAEFYLYQNKIDKCTEILNLLPYKYPDHTLSDEVYYLKAQVQEKLGNYVKAIELYEKVYTYYSSDILADNSLFRSANIQLHILNNPKKALGLFENLLLNYNSSLYALDARKVYYNLKEQVNDESIN